MNDGQNHLFNGRLRTFRPNQKDDFMYQQFLLYPAKLLWNDEN